MPDYVRTLLESYEAATGRLMSTPADYDQAVTWRDGGIPLTVAQAGVEAKLARAQGKGYLRTMPLSWCHDDVVEGYQNWRRAVGPYAGVDNGA